MKIKGQSRELVWERVLNGASDKIETKLWNSPWSHSSWIHIPYDIQSKVKVHILDGLKDQLKGQVEDQIEDQILRQVHGQVLE
jgi:hypothetical protein